MRIPHGVLTLLLASAALGQEETDRPICPDEQVRFGCHSNATDEDLAKLAQHPQLREVDLISDKITDAGVAHLKALPKLESLVLNSSTITDAGVSVLTELPNLRRLVLGRTRFSPGGYAVLKKLPALRKLCLMRVTLTDESVEALQGLTRLETLDFEQLKPESQTAAAALARRLPVVRVTIQR
jgi:Leucine-rich repeat (LRR) protein